MILEDTGDLQKEMIPLTASFNKTRLTFNTSEELKSYHPYLIKVTAWNIDGAGFTNKTVFLIREDPTLVQNSTMQPSDQNSTTQSLSITKQRGTA